MSRNLNLLNARHQLLRYATLQVFLALGQPPVLLGSNQQPRTLRIDGRCVQRKLWDTFSLLGGRMSKTVLLQCKFLESDLQKGIKTSGSKLSLE